MLCLCVPQLLHVTGLSCCWEDISTTRRRTNVTVAYQMVVHDENGCKQCVAAVRARVACIRVNSALTDPYANHSHCKAGSTRCANAIALERF